jgi:Flp pilus assembly protein TadG
MIRFWQDKRGSVAIIVAVSAMLLVVIAGSAVDFATDCYVRGSLQSAVDSASLAAGRLNIDPKDSISVKEQQLTDEARNVFSANLDLSPGPLDLARHDRIHGKNTGGWRQRDKNHHA